VVTSQRRTVASFQPPAARIVPSGEKAIELTPNLKASNVVRSRPEVASQSLTVPSQLPVAIVFPSGENATDLTALPWPRSVRRGLPSHAACGAVEMSDADRETLFGAEARPLSPPMLPCPTAIVSPVAGSMRTRAELKLSA